MTRRYQKVNRPDRRSAPDPAKLASLLARVGQLLLPLLDLIEHAEAAIDDLIDNGHSTTRDCMHRVKRWKERLDGPAMDGGVLGDGLQGVPPGYVLQ